jgi:Na+/H+ antiporter NhaC
MRDKFKANFRIVWPAALIICILYIFLGSSVTFIPEHGHIDWHLLIPYILVIALALSGVNVLAVLAIGIGINAILGLGFCGLSWTGLLKGIGEGIAGMGDLIIVTLLAGGMLELIRINGGIDWIVGAMTRNIKGKRGAELSIAALVSFANMCTANNTIAIITVGGISSDISRRFGLDPRRVASILDTFSCMVQGLIPYGAQLLLASGLTGVSVFSISSYLYYPLVMGVCSLLAILIRKS